jgi:hypothetical protein
MSPIYHVGRTRKRLGERLRFATSRVNCFVWAESAGDAPIRGFGFLSDISEEGAGIYVDTKLPKSTVVTLAIEDENSTHYRGIVLWCRRYSMSQRLHSQATLDHRIGVQIVFASEEERQRYLMYFNDLRKRAAFLKGEFKF